MPEISEESKKGLNIRLIISVLVVIISLSALVYILTALYFRNRFLPNTWIGDVYCTGRDADSIASDLRDKIIIPDITIGWNDGNNDDSKISSESIGYTYDLQASVYKSMSSQNSFSWPAAFFRKNILHLIPVISYDESKLAEIYESLDVVKNENADVPDCRIIFDPKEGYILKDTHYHRLDSEKTYDALKDCLENGRLRLDLDESFYADIPYSGDEKARQSEFEKISAFLNTDLVYDMGAEKISFDSTLMSFLIVSENGMPALDKDGEYIIDDDKVTEWVHKLCEDYNTFGLEREFNASNGKTVYVPATYSDYGTEINETAELKFIRAALKSDETWDGVPDVHIPEYKHEGFVRGLDDIGDTFVEVDLIDQYLYYYKNGELILETDIVSGDISKGWMTPRGTFAVYGKSTDQYLYGRDYIDFVSYWMPYFRGYGFHDSDWRDEWGGEIYTYDGSHGCINMNKESARTLYENIEIGTPVIVYDY
mgnify:CR=1 FL=1